MHLCALNIKLPHWQVWRQNYFFDTQKLVFWFLLKFLIWLYKKSYVLHETKHKTSSRVFGISSNFNWIIYIYINNHRNSIHFVQSSNKTIRFYYEIRGLKYHLMISFLMNRFLRMNLNLYLKWNVSTNVTHHCVSFQSIIDGFT